jgi:4-hydroxy-3-methylbut-2-en-1-yl diphosphate synthase IspG/GcpE
LRAAAEALARAGADLVRLDCATPADVEALRLLAPGCALPLLADIGGGDPALAVAAVEAGARGVWLSPLSQDGLALAELAALARSHGCMLGLRLGLPGASALLAAPSSPIALAQLALRETARLAELGCADVVIALRLDDPVATIAATRALGRSCDWPLALAPGAAGVSGGGDRRRCARDRPAARPGFRRPDPPADGTRSSSRGAWRRAGYSGARAASARRGHRRGGGVCASAP